MPTGIHEKLGAAIEFALKRKSRLRTFGMAIAILIFMSGLFLALRYAPRESLQLQLRILALYALFLPPMAYILQSAELWLSAKAVGVRLSLRHALEIIIYSSAAALLPIPGGFLTRTAILSANGVSVARSASVVLLFTGIAGTISFAYSGLWVLPREPVLGIGGLVIAAVGTTVCLALSRNLDVPNDLLRKGILLRVLTVMFETASFVVIFAAIGTMISVQQAAFLVVSGFLAMALTVFPSGIGIKEAIVALISPLVGIDPATGFLAAATGRVVGLFWMAAIGTVFLLTGTERRGEAG